MANEIKILLVDDRKENLTALIALLDIPGLEIITATSGNEALGLLLEHEFAVVLLDVQMPGMDGFEVASLMRGKEQTKYTPIIFVTAISKEKKYIFKGYESGAVDYLFKPLDPTVLKSKINIFIDLHRHKKELEESRRLIEKQNIQLKELAIRDGLTGLYNHRYLEEIIGREFALSVRNHTDISCFMMDLDYFKEVNDTFGHEFGDFVLQSFARLGKGIIRKTDVFARYGGEEFLLLLPNTGLDGSRILAEKFRCAAEKHIYRHLGYSRQVTVSIGIASCFFHRPESPKELISFADKALYRAKAGGRNQVRIYLEEKRIKTGTAKNHHEERLFALADAFPAVVPSHGPPNPPTPEEIIDKPDKQAGKRFDPILVRHLMDIIREKQRLPVPGERIREAGKKIQHEHERTGNEYIAKTVTGPAEKAVIKRTRTTATPGKTGPPLKKNKEKNK